MATFVNCRQLSRRSRYGRVSFICASIVALLVTAGTGAWARQYVTAAPTKEQIKAEVKKMADHVNAHYPNYVKFANAVKAAMSLNYDVSALKDATILMPDNNAWAAFTKLVPPSSKNLPKMYNVTAYHVLITKMTLAFLRKQKPRAFATMLKQPQYKQTPVNAVNVSFGLLRSPKPKWCTVITARIYQGPYFISHGVDNIVIPKGTQVP
ncbi:hypothetical protein CLOM_g6459 [Closterium sp. NIES-68]|nr:hypothetical protein CLOM_g6459 [Closterium sp. NIES-68]GJP86837.1 hypothetical protein CLOP_g16812 [Closterium sp. NIES-67]